MASPLHGRVHGTTIELDSAPEGLEGRRVLVVVEPAEEASLSPEAQRAAWDVWAGRGPQGPIEDDGEPAFP
jgi:hypothetical protein